MRAYMLDELGRFGSRQPTTRPLQSDFSKWEPGRLNHFEIKAGQTQHGCFGIDPNCCATPILTHFSDGKFLLSPSIVNQVGGLSPNRQ